MASDYLEKSKKYKGYHYSELTQEMIDYLHITTLEILKNMIKIFDKYNIRYYICGGTLLGAYTTGKWIPWDDDIDLCVLDEDYEIMKEKMLKELPDWIQVQCPETEPNYYHGWMKIRDKNSCVYPIEPKYCYNGVFVDVYKLSKVKRKDIEILKVTQHLDYLERRFAVGCITKEEMNKRITENDLLNKLQAAKNKSNAIADLGDCYMLFSASKMVIEPEWLLRKNILFEGVTVSTFCDPASYLIQHYGEKYRQLPPDDLRRIGINKITYKVF